jgi:hypothetical protein
VVESEAATGPDAGPRDVPPLPAPWRPLAEGGPPLRGCGRPLLAGCGCGAVAVLAVLVLATLRAPQLVAWSVGMWEEQVMSGLPADVSAQERSRLTAAFDSLSAAISSGRLPVDGLFEVFGEINRAIAGSQRGELSRDDVLRLIEALERAGADRPPTPDPEAARRTVSRPPARIGAGAPA